MNPARMPSAARVPNSTVVLVPFNQLNHSLSNENSLGTNITRKNSGKPTMAGNESGSSLGFSSFE